MIKKFLHFFLSTLLLLIPIALGTTYSTRAFQIENHPDISRFVELERIGRGSISAISLSPNGETLAVATSIGIWLYDLETLEPLIFMEGGTNHLSSITWSPNGHMLAAGSFDSTIHIWDAEQGTELATLTGHTAPVTSIAWSPDGRMIASGSADTTIRLWDAEEGVERGVLSGHTETVNSIAWSPDSTHIGSAGDQTVRIWSITSDEEPLVLKNEVNPDRVGKILSLTWSPDGSEIAAAGNIGGDLDGEFMIWNTLTGNQTRGDLIPLTQVYTIAWQPNGRKIALSGYNSFIGLHGTKIIDLDSSDYTMYSDDIFGADNTYIITTIWTPDGNRLVNFERGSTIRIWDAASHEQLDTLEHSVEFPEWASASSLGFVSIGYSSSPDGKYQTIPSEGIVEIHTADPDIVAYYLYYQLSGTMEPVIAWSPDNHYLAIQATNSSALVLERETWQIVATFDIDTGNVLAMDWSPDSQFLVMSTNDEDYNNIDGAIRIWEVKTAQEVTSKKFSDTRVAHIAWLPESRYILFSTTVDFEDSIVFLWDIEQDVEIRIAEIRYVQYSPGIYLSPDNNIMTIVNQEKIYLLDISSIENIVESLEGMVTLEGNWQTVGHIGWSADETRMAAQVGDGTVRIWGLP